MIIGIHQPNYLPYLGFFDKMKRSDIFVIYDDAQFEKGEFQHPVYKQRYEGFVPNMAAIDALFNVGKIPE